MAVTSVSASLRLCGLAGSDTAALVTAALGVEPTESYEFGDPHPSPALAARGKVTTGPLWLFEEPRTIESDEDPHGIESLVRLAARFEPFAETLRELSTNYDIEVGMSGESDSSQGGLYIGPKTMRALGTLSAAFVQTIYLTEEYTADEVADWKFGSRDAAR